MAATTPTPPAPTRRERVRAATMAEIKATALDLMRGGTVGEVRFADIARELGMTAPALYRYFGDRDDLLTALISDAYADLAATLHTAADDVAEPRKALDAVMRAYRGWANADPVQFGLVFGMPIAGYAVPAAAGTVVSARSAMAALEAVPLRRGRASRTGPLVRDVGVALLAALPATRNIAEGELAPATHQAMFLVWTALHGFTSLEAFGHMAWLGEAARDDLFDAQIELAARTLAL